MTAKEAYKLTIYLPEEDMVMSLQKLAASLGYIQDRGPSARDKKGSIGKLMGAIAEGKIKLVREE